MENTNNQREAALAGGLINVGISSIVNVLLGFITTPLITRITDPVEYGRLSIFNTYTSIVVSIAFLGLEQGFTRFFFQYSKKENKIGLIKFCLLLPTVFSLLIYVIAFVLLHLKILNLDLNSNILILIMFNVFVTILNTIVTLLLTSIHKNAIYSICSILQKASYCILLIVAVLIFNNSSLEALAFVTILSLLIPSLFGILATKDYFIFNKTTIISNYDEIIKYSTPFVAYCFFEALFDSMDKLFVDAYCTDYEVGIYTTALTLVGIFSIVRTVFRIVWSPIQTEHYITNPEQKEFLQRGNIYITIVMMLFGASIIAFKEVFSILLGKSYQEAISIMPFLVVCPIMYSVSDTTISGIGVSKKSYLLVVSSIISCAFSCLLNLLLVNKMGIKGATISNALASIVFFLTRTYFSNRYYYIDYKLKEYFLVTLLLLVYAYECTFYNILIVNILFYIVFIIAIYVLYKEYIIDLVKTIYKLFKRTVKKI